MCRLPLEVPAAAEDDTADLISTDARAAFKADRAEPTSELNFVLRGLVLPIYIPAVTLGVGNKLIMPVLPLFARYLGAPDATVGAVQGAEGLGSICAGVACASVQFHAPSAVSLPFTTCQPPNCCWTTAVERPPITPVL